MWAVRAGVREYTWETMQMAAPGWTTSVISPLTARVAAVIDSGRRPDGVMTRAAFGRARILDAERRQERVVGGRLRLAAHVQPQI
jgi:hypothetical protein